MTLTVLGIVSSVLLIIIGLWKYNSRKNRYRREQAEKAKASLDNANKTGSASDFLDGFGGVRK
jgi:FtsZ-interacting cell division protein ZipA